MKKGEFESTWFYIVIAGVFLILAVIYVMGVLIPEFRWW
jgi:hypothetical protein